MIRIMTDKKLKRLLKRAYEQGLKLNMSQYKNGGLFAGYDLNRELADILKEKGGKS